MRMHILSILEESSLLLEYYRVPPKVLEPLKKYYMEAIRKVKANNIQRITKSSFPIKKFKLDFTGTQYEFLNSIDTHIQIKLSSNDGYYEPSGKIIVLPVSGDSGLNYHAILEHELLHFIQTLIKEYRAKNDKFHKKGSGIGGLVGKKAMGDISDRVDVQGYVKGSSYNKRTTHAHRPIEHLPNLNTLTRRMELFYSRLDNKTSKKEFFWKHLRSDSFTIKMLRDVKNQSLKLYNHYLKTLFNAFVNESAIDDIAGLDDKLSVDTGNGNGNASNIGSNNVDSDLSVTLKNNTFSIDIYDAADWSELEEDNLEFIENLGRYTVGITEYENRDGYFFYRFPLSPAKIKNILHTWKDMSNSASNAEEKSNYEIVSRNMLKEYSRELRNLRFSASGSRKGITHENISTTVEDMEKILDSLWN